MDSKIKPYFIGCCVLMDTFNEPILTVGKDNEILEEGCLVADIKKIFDKHGIKTITGTVGYQTGKELSPVSFVGESEYNDLFFGIREANIVGK